MERENLSRQFALYREIYGHDRLSCPLCGAKRLRTSTPEVFDESQFTYNSSPRIIHILLIRNDS